MSIRSRQIEQNFKNYLLKKFTTHALRRRRKNQVKEYPATRVLLAGNYACFKEHNTRHRLLKAPATKLFLAFVTNGEKPCAYFQSSYDCIVKALNKGIVRSNGKPLHALDIPKGAVMSKLQQRLAYDTKPNHDYDRNEIMITIDEHLQKAANDTSFANLMRCDKTGAVAAKLFNALNDFVAKATEVCVRKDDASELWLELADEFHNIPKLAKSDRYKFSGYPFGRNFELFAQNKKLCTTHLKSAWDSVMKVKMEITVFYPNCLTHHHLIKQAKVACDAALNAFSALREQPEMTT